MGRKRVIILLLVTVMLTIALSGCGKKIYITTGLEKDEIFKLSGDACSLAEILLVLMAEKERFEKDFGEGVWNVEVLDGRNLEDEIKLKVKNQMAQLKTVEQLAKKEGIELTDSEKELISEAALYYFSGLSDVTSEKLGLTLESVKELYTSFYLSEKVYEKLTKDVNIEISDEESRVVSVKYLTSKSREVADDVYSMLARGSDFSTTADMYECFVYEGYISREDVSDKLGEVIFNLEDGQLSEVVVTDEGFSVILCLCSYEKVQSEEHKARLQDKYKKEVYDSIYIPFEKEQTFEFNNKVWADIKFTDYENIDVEGLYEVYNERLVQN